MPLPANLTPATIIEGNAAAALACLAWEICITFGDEVEYIWTKPALSWTKWCYFMTRYFPLVAAILFQLRRLPVPITPVTSPQYCVKWFIWDAVATRLSSTSMEIIQMTRVYALYNRTIWVAVTLVFLLAFELIIATVTIIRAFSDLYFDPCRPSDDGHPMVFLYAAITVNQCVIMALTIFKYINDYRTVYKKIPIVALMIRDGTVAFMFILVVSVPALVISIVYPAITSYGYGWFLAISSATSCRLIVNMQRLAASDSKEHPEDECSLPPEFTTRIQALDDESLYIPNEIVIGEPSPLS